MATICPCTPSTRRINTFPASQTATRARHAFLRFTTTSLQIALRHTLSWNILNLNPAQPRTPPQRVAKALQWLRDLPAPPDVTIGSLGGGRARHPLFKDFEAPLSFSSIDALERYTNKARNYIHPRARPDPVSFSGEQCIHSVQYGREKLPRRYGREHVPSRFRGCGLLPESFASYTMSLIWNKPFVKEVAEYLQWPAPRSSHSMARIGSILQMIGDETLGLNEDGRPKPRRRGPKF